MTRQVSLSEDAYSALRREKREAESFSQAVMRLLATARRAEKDPMKFVGRRRRRVIPVEEHLALVEQWRDEDLVEPRA